MPPTTHSVGRIRLRAQTHYLTQRCTIDQQDKDTAIVGGAATWTTIHSDVPCRLVLQRQFARNEVIDIAGLEIIGELYVLVLPQRYILPSNSRVLVDSLYYDVVNVKQHLSDKVFNIYVVTRQEGL